MLDLHIFSYYNNIVSGKENIVQKIAQKNLEIKLLPEDIKDLNVGNYQYKLKATLAKKYSYSSKEIKYEEKDLTNMLRFQIIGE